MITPTPSTSEQIQKPKIPTTEEIINKYFPKIKEENKVVISQMLIEFGEAIIIRCADRVLTNYTQQRIKNIKEELITYTPYKNE